jgi:cold shock CspA family protein
MQGHEIQSQVGTISKNSGGFGFIKPDVGDGAEMFVMPVGCIGFGGVIPPIGTPVQYIVVTDGKTGRPRADNVEPVGGAAEYMLPGAADYGGGVPHFQQEYPGGQPVWEPIPQMWQPQDGRRLGTVLKNNGKFGFISQDCGEPDMFLMPMACKSWGGSVPEEGVRVLYDVVIDAKTGRPRAEDVEPVQEYGGAASRFLDDSGGLTPAYGAMAQRPNVRSQPYGQPSGIDLRQVAGPPNHSMNVTWGMAPPMHMPVQQPVPQVQTDSQVLTGTMASINGKFGFIKQDNGEADMFVMPAACRHHGEALPAPGSRLQYQVMTDQKTGRPRAENVVPI